MNMGTMTCKCGKNEVRTWIPLALDFGERIILLGFYAWFAYRIIVNSLAQGSVPNIIYLCSEGVVVLLILIRRTTFDVSLRPGDWILAFAGTTLPLMTYPDMEKAWIPPVVATVIMVSGMLVQISAKLILGRSWGCVPANRGVKLAGPYRFVRHPMYAGYLLTHIGFLLTNPTVWNLGVYVLCYYFQISRILAEERLLQNDPCYSEYMSTVRYRLVPGVF